MNSELLRAADALCAAAKAYESSRNTYPEWLALQEAVKEYGRARSRPLRNCDLVKSYDDAEERFASFCVCQPNCSSCRFNDPHSCRARWLLASAQTGDHKGEKR